MSVLALLSVLFLTVNALPVDEQITPDNAGKNWYLLCAGMNGWDINYSIQANIYHTYQVLHANGVKDENIIVMHYDDLATNPQNPTPGVVINKPNGENVYNGVPKDYTGEDVTPENFLGALSGNKTLANKGKKVIKSGPNDNIFVFFMDHGAPDLVVFIDKYLYATDLNNALKDMHKNKKFAKLVFYIESCESGSMFNQHLPKDINVYGVSSSTPDTPSYPCFYDDNLQAWLAGDFSNYFLYNSEHEDLNKETLQQQFDYIHENTLSKQEAQQYGDLSIAKLPVSKFLGTRKAHNSTLVECEETNGDIVIETYMRKIKKTNDLTKKQLHVKNLELLLKGRQMVDNVLEKFVNSIHDLLGVETNEILTKRQSLNNHECYRQFVDTFHQKCFNLNHNTYVLRKFNTFVNVCENIKSHDVNTALNKLVHICDSDVKPGYPIRIE